MNTPVQSTPSRVAAARPVATNEPTQYLTFMLGAEVYAIAILGIKEIIEYPELTVVPMMPACVRGVINLRGAVVPVMDLQSRFGRVASPITKASCIVIVELGPQAAAGDPAAQRQVIGLIVDAVNEVLDIAPADIEPPPAFGARVSREFIQGMGKVKGRFVILLDVDQTLSLAELGALTALPSECPEAGRSRPPPVGVQQSGAATFA